MPKTDRSWIREIRVASPYLKSGREEHARMKKRLREARKVSTLRYKP